MVLVGDRAFTGFYLKAADLTALHVLILCGSYRFLLHPRVPFRIGGVRYDRVINCVHHRGSLVLEGDRAFTDLDPGPADPAFIHVPVLYRGYRILFYPGVPLGLICPGLRPRIPEVPYD